MKIKSVFTFLLILGILVPWMISAQNTTTDKTPVKIGVSRINVTPETPTVMGGYGLRTTPFTGVHDDLYASALYFSGEKIKALLITADLLSFPSVLVDDLKKSISIKTGIPSENIMISTVHNHGGPGTRNYDTDSLHTVEAYLKILKEKLTSLSFDAMKNPVPFQMGIGKSFCNMNINRRAVFADGSTGLGRNPDKPCDHELVAVKFTDMNNKTLAVLVNWPCHGTVSGPDNYKITADWPGATARYIRNQAGDDIVVAVTAGASADINPIYGPGSNFKEIESIGFHVGNEAWKSLSEAPTYSVNNLQFKNAVMILPGKKIYPDELPHSTYEKGPDTEIRLSLLKIGPLILSGISGELMTEIGMEIKKRSPYSETLIVTHCNGSSGYICTDKSFPEGGYEVSVTKLMPGAEKPLINKYMELINSF
jgi:neutral ceramidase